jgi:hypothetical protein
MDHLEDLSSNLHAGVGRAFGPVSRTSCAMSELLARGGGDPGNDPIALQLRSLNGQGMQGPHSSWT